MNRTEIAAMRVLGTFLLITLIISGATPLGYTQSSNESFPPATDDARLSITKDVMDGFAHDQFSLVREHFCSDLKTSLTEDDLKDGWDEIVSASGVFQRQLSQTSRTVHGVRVYIAKSQFENFKVELRLTFNDTSQITDISMVPVSDISADTMEASAKAVAELLRHGRFDLLNAKFTDQMKDAFPPERLEANWVHVLMHLGEFKSIKQAAKDPDMDLVNVTCHFENGEANVRIAFDPLGKVSGIWILPVESAPSRDILQA